MQQQVAVHQKLSSQLTLSSSSSSGSAADMPARAALVVHEIFGTDPLSEHVLPALRQVQQELAAPNARFVPCRIRVVAAVATCPALQQRLRLPQQQAVASAIPFDVSSLLPLQPRKVELQLDDLASDLQLLTAPANVLEIDFEKEWPLRLNGQVDVGLPAFETAMLLSTWMEQQQLQPQGQGAFAEQQQQQGMLGGGPIQQQKVKGLQQKKGAAAAAAAKELCVVSWFEADCGAGGWLSTAPGTTKYGHWQQSVEFVAGPPAAAAAVAAAVLGGGLQVCEEEEEAEGEEEGSGSSGSSSSSRMFMLRVNWAVDRLKFSLTE
jgi:hypothetical protein